MNPTWFQHVDLMNVVIGALFLAVIWFMVRTLKKIDDNQSALFQRLNALSEEFHTLKGEHQVMAGRCQVNIGTVQK